MSFTKIRHDQILSSDGGTGNYNWDLINLYPVNNYFESEVLPPNVSIYGSYEVGYDLYNPYSKSTRMIDFTVDLENYAADIRFFGNVEFGKFTFKWRVIELEPGECTFSVITPELTGSIPIIEDDVDFDSWMEWDDGTGQEFIAKDNVTFEIKILCTSGRYKISISDVEIDWRFPLKMVGERILLESKNPAIRYADLVLSDSKQTKISKLEFTNLPPVPVFVPPPPPDATTWYDVTPLENYMITPSAEYYTSENGWYLVNTSDVTFSIGEGGPSLVDYPLWYNVFPTKMRITGFSGDLITIGIIRNSTPVQYGIFESGSYETPTPMGDIIIDLDLNGDMVDTLVFRNRFITNPDLTIGKIEIDVPLNQPQWWDVTDPKYWIPSTDWNLMAAYDPIIGWNNDNDGLLVLNADTYVDGYLWKKRKPFKFRITTGDPDVLSEGRTLLILQQDPDNSICYTTQEPNTTVEYDNDNMLELASIESWNFIKKIEIFDYFSLILPPEVTWTDVTDISNWDSHIGIWDNNNKIWTADTQFTNDISLTCSNWDINNYIPHYVRVSYSNTNSLISIEEDYRSGGIIQYSYPSQQILPLNQNNVMAGIKFLGGDSTIMISKIEFSPPPPIPVQYNLTDITSNSYWTASQGGWDGSSSWVTQMPGEILLQSTPALVTTSLPTKLRIIFTGSMKVVRVTDPTGGGWSYQFYNVTSGQVLNLTLTEKIGRIYVDDLSHGSFTISKVEIDTPLIQPSWFDVTATAFWNYDANYDAVNGYNTSGSWLTLHTKRSNNTDPWYSRSPISVRVTTGPNNPGRSGNGMRIYSTYGTVVNGIQAQNSIVEYTLSPGDELDSINSENKITKIEIFDFTGLTLPPPAFVDQWKIFGVNGNDNGGSYGAIALDYGDGVNYPLYLAMTPTSRLLEIYDNTTKFHAIDIYVDGLTDVISNASAIYTYLSNGGAEQNFLTNGHVITTDGIISFRFTNVSSGYTVAEIIDQFTVSLMISTNTSPHTSNFAVMNMVLTNSPTHTSW